MLYEFCPFAFLAAIFILLCETATINQSVPIKDSDPQLQKLVYSVGIHGVNDQIRDSVYWVPATQSFSATRLITPAGGDRHYTWQFKILAQKSTCSRASVPYSKVKNCKPDQSASQKKTCSVYISYNEKDQQDSMESEVHCQ